MSTESLLAHELLCLHLRSFCGIEPCSPGKKESTMRSKKATGKSIFSLAKAATQEERRT
jgi:hypothetical protein